MKVTCRTSRRTPSWVVAGQKERRVVNVTSGGQKTRDTWLTSNKDVHTTSAKEKYRNYKNKKGKKARKMGAKKRI